MTKRWNALTRKLAPVLAAGMLLQAGGCEFNTSELAAGLVTSIANSVLTNLVFGVFNLI